MGSLKFRVSNQGSWAPMVRTHTSGILGEDVYVSTDREARETSENVKIFGKI